MRYMGRFSTRAPDGSIGGMLAQAREPLLSVEFFPPASDAGGQQILDTAAALKAVYAPAFVSITYGAGGTTRERTLRYARLLREDYGFLVMPHLTCVGSTRAELIEIVRGYHDEGFRNIMALRGDPPKGETEFTPHPEGCRYGSDLVALLRGSFTDLCLGVGGYPETHPEAPSADADLANLLLKVKSGADFITTQLFFDNAAYFGFVERARAAGVTVPIVPGLLPALSLSQVQRFCALGGASLPAELEDRLRHAGEDADAVREVGVQWALAQIRELYAAGVPAVHLYSLNRSASALRLVELLGDTLRGCR